MKRFSRIITPLCLVTLLFININQTKTLVFAKGSAETRATIVVTTFTDEYGTGEACSLREAITAANSNAAFGGCPAGTGSDTIQLSEGTYTLSIAGSKENSNETGDLDISEDISIVGIGMNKTIIDGDNLDRVFDIMEDPFMVINVTLESLHIRNGMAPSGTANTDGENGGGIRSGGNLVLEQVELYHNDAGNGGDETGNGGHGGGIYAKENLTLANSSLHYNYAGDGGNIEVNNGGQEFAGMGGDGGGILALGTTIIENSVINNNYAGDAGDGIIGEPSYSTYAGNGGGIASSGNITITTSEIRSNIGGYAGAGPSLAGQGGNGGGVFNTGTLIIEGSTFNYNRSGNGTSLVSPGYGSGIFNAEGGISTITKSSVINNQDPFSGSQPKGGGIYNNGDMSIANSTIAFNEEPYYGGGIYNGYYGVLDINASTIAENESQKGGGIYIYDSPSGSVTIQNSLISQNVGWQGGYDCEGTIISEGYNFIRDLTSKIGGQPYPVVCTITGDMTGVTTGTENNPLISLIGYYGSETKTFIPLSGSPLIEAGNPLSPGSGGNACPATDQRGVNRPQSTYCDIGATEASAQLSVTKSVDIIYTYPGQLITFSISVENTGAESSTDTTVYDDLPAGLIFQGPVTLNPVHPEATVATSAMDLPYVVTGLELTSGESVTVYLPVKTDLNYPGGEIITNIAKAYSPIPQSEGSGQRWIKTGWILFLPIVEK